tara:strand:- start:2232 stop:2642 length:411 start_codon:yes stop_codon:yes gene_type:complete
MIILILIIIIIVFLYFRYKEPNDYDKILFINKIDKERYIILKNCIKEFKKKCKIKSDKYFDYLHDIYTEILELCYSLHIEKLKSKNIKKLNDLIYHFKINYYNDIMKLKKYSKNPNLLNNYEVVPANYRLNKNMLP